MNHLCLLLLLVALGAGCQTGMVWYKPGSSAQQTNEDIAHARLKAMNWHPPRAPAQQQTIIIQQSGADQQYNTTSAYQGINEGQATMQEAIARRQYFNTIMQSKGYRLVKQPKPSSPQE